MADEVSDNRAESRYELRAGSGVAIAAYELTASAITFTHTIVPEELRGHGMASRLIGSALADAARRGLSIEAECPFVADYLERHSPGPDQATGVQAS